MGGHRPSLVSDKLPSTAKHRERTKEVAHSHAANTTATAEKATALKQMWHVDGLSSLRPPPLAHCQIRPEPTFESAQTAYDHSETNGIFQSTRADPLQPSAQRVAPSHTTLMRKQKPLLTWRLQHRVRPRAHARHSETGSRLVSSIFVASGTLSAHSFATARSEMRRPVPDIHGKGKAGLQSTCSPGADVPDTSCGARKREGRGDNGNPSNAANPATRRRGRPNGGGWPTS